MNIVFFGFKRDGLAYLDDVQAEALKNVTVRSGDVLLNITGASIGRVTTAPPEMDGARVNQHVCIIRTSEYLDPRFLAAYLSSPEMQAHIGSQNYGVTRQALTKTQILEFRIPLPPVGEQKRIIEALISLHTRIQEARKRIRRLPAILKRFREAVLEAAVSGKLTEEWRGTEALVGNLNAESWLRDLLVRRRENAANGSRLREPTEPDLRHWSLSPPTGWKIASVSAFSECLDNLRVPVKRDARKSSRRLFPYYGANGMVDMVDEYIFDDELVLVTEDETFYGRQKPIAYRSSGKCWVNNHAHVLRAVDGESADYLCFCLMYYNVIPWLTGTTGRAKLTQGVLNSLPIAVPPPAELREIVRRVKELLAAADTMEKRFESARNAIDSLMPTLLDKAFRGDLVPQDSADEPASVLLERVRKGREESSATPKRAQRTETDRSEVETASPQRKRSTQRRTPKVATRSGSSISGRAGPARK